MTCHCRLLFIVFLHEVHSLAACSLTVTNCLKNVLHFNNRVSYGEVGLGFLPPPSKHTHIQHISPISLHINLLIFHAKASEHTPYTIHHTSPSGGELGLPESLSCLITGAVQLHLACLPSSKLAPCYKVYILKLKSNLLGVEPPVIGLAQLRSHLFKMEYYGGVGYFGEKF